MNNETPRRYTKSLATAEKELSEMRRHATALMRSFFRLKKLGRLDLLPEHFDYRSLNYLAPLVDLKKRGRPRSQRKEQEQQKSSPKIRELDRRMAQSRMVIDELSWPISTQFLLRFWEIQSSADAQNGLKLKQIDFCREIREYYWWLEHRRLPTPYQQSLRQYKKDVKNLESRLAKARARKKLPARKN